MQFERFINELSQFEKNKTCTVPIEKFSSLVLPGNAILLQSLTI